MLFSVHNHASLCAHLWFYVKCGPGGQAVTHFASILLPKHAYLRCTTENNSNEVHQGKNDAPKSKCSNLPRKLSLISVLLPIKQNTELRNNTQRGFNIAQLKFLEAGTKEEKGCSEVWQDSLDPCQSLDKKNKRGQKQSASPRGPKSTGTGVQEGHCQLALQARLPTLTILMVPAKWTLGL